MTHTATYRRDDLGPLTADVTEHHEIVIRYDDDGYTRIHEDALGPLLRAADYQLDDELHRCPSVHHPGGHPTRCERWLNHEGRHDSRHYSWTDDTRQPAPTEEAAALHSAELANEQHGKHCARYHAPGERCIGTGSECGYCGVRPAQQHTPGCTRPR